MDLINELWSEVLVCENVQTWSRLVEFQAVVWHGLNPEALNVVFDLDVLLEGIYAVSDEKFLVIDGIGRVFS